MERPRRSLPTALVTYIEDYAQANLRTCWRGQGQCEPQTSAAVDPNTGSLMVIYGHESDRYCILLHDGGAESVRSR